MHTLDMLLPRLLSLEYWQINPSTIWQINWAHYKQKFTSYTSWAQLALADDQLKEVVTFILQLGARSQDLSLEEALDYIRGPSDGAL